MNFQERADYIKPILDGAQKVMVDKGKEYARDSDANANFKRIAAWFGDKPIRITPEIVGMIYLLKHLDSIVFYADRLADGEVPQMTEPIDGRVQDAVNYALIEGSLLREREAALGVVAAPVLAPKAFTFSDTELFNSKGQAFKRLENGDSRRCRLLKEGEETKQCLQCGHINAKWHKECCGCNEPFKGAQ